MLLAAAATIPVRGRGVPEGSPSGRAWTVADTLLARLTQGSVPLGSVSDGLRELAEVVRAETAGTGWGAVSDADSARAVRASSPGLDEDRIVARIRYDKFFGVRRVPGLTPEQLHLGVMNTVARVCEDAGEAVIGLPEITALVRGIRGMVAAVDGVELPGSRQVEAVVTGSGPDCPEERALRRWLTGHHVFALCCAFGRHHLDHARGRVGCPTEPDAALVGHLRLAETYVRASSAAMTYASSFSRSLYRDHVRPLMDRASGRTHGFSGVDNYDFHLMRQSWEQLHEALAACEPPSSWDRDVAVAALELFGAIVEDNERHTLIAAAMVGVEPSLKQVRAMSSIAVGGNGTPAVEALRQNTDERRELMELFAAL